MSRVAVIGAGLHRYGKWDEKSLFDLAQPAITGALKTAGLEWNQVQSAWCGHIGQGISCGALLFSQFGFTGLSITNVENASASGSYAFRGAYLDIISGQFDIALALGIEKRRLPSRRQSSGNGKSKEKAKHRGVINLPMLKFAQDAREHMEKYGTTIDQLAMVSVKNHRNGSLNPYAQYQQEVTLEEVHNARMVADPLTVLHCCPVGDGAAAAILASERVVKEMNIPNPIWIDASVSKSTFAPADDPRDLSAITAEDAYEAAGIGPSDLDLVELHDAFTIEEIMIAEYLGLCGEGEGGQLVEQGATEIGGRIPVNASGGLLAMGHPIGPTGIGQIAEIFWQLRGEAGRRQIPNAPRTGLAHMIGFGGTCIIHIFSR